MTTGAPISYGQEPAPRHHLQDMIEGRLITTVILDETGWDTLGYVDGWPTAAFEFDSAEVLIVSGVPNVSVGAAYSAVLPMCWIPGPLYLTKDRALALHEGRPAFDRSNVQRRLRGKLVRRAYVVREATKDGAEQMLWEFSDQWKLWIRAGRERHAPHVGTLELELVEPGTFISLPTPNLIDRKPVTRLANRRESVEAFIRDHAPAPKPIEP